MVPAWEVLPVRLNGRQVSAGRVSWKAGAQREDGKEGARGGREVRERERRERERRGGEREGEREEIGRRAREERREREREIERERGASSPFRRPRQISAGRITRRRTHTHAHTGAHAHTQAHTGCLIPAGHLYCARGGSDRRHRGGKVGGGGRH